MTEPNELTIITSKWGSKEIKPTLVISIDALAEILQAERAVVKGDDVARLMGSIHSYAAKADRSERKALDAWETEVECMEEDE